jgi:hypothetical protein
MMLFIMQGDEFKNLRMPEMKGGREIEGKEKRAEEMVDG